MRARRWALVAVFFGLVACSPETTAPTVPEPATTQTAPPAPTTTASVAPSSTPPPTPTKAGSVEGPGPHGVETYLPVEPGGAPVAVLVHGGGWVGGLPASMEPLGRALAERGMVVFNASYRTLIAGGGYPATFDDIACAIRYARSRAAELGASDDLVLVGHSAGAHLAAAVALTGDAFGGDCSWEGSAVPGSLVGMAGIYRLENVAPVMEALLGGTREALPEIWAAADPYQHLEAAGEVAVRIIHGLDDEIVPTSSSQDFAFALQQAGQEIAFELIEGANHMDMIDPEVAAPLIAP